MSDHSTYYREVAATLIELASRIVDPEIKGELIDTAISFEKLAAHTHSWNEHLEVAPPSHEPHEEGDWWSAIRGLKNRR